jgi:hypothetical protein
LPVPGGTEEEGVSVLGDPVPGGQLEDQGPVHLLVEVEVEGVQPLADVAEAGEFEPAFEEPVLATDEFVLDEARDEVDRRQLLGLRFDEAGFEGGGDAGAPELAQGALQFDDVHGVTSWVFRAMTSR